MSLGLLVRGDLTVVLVFELGWWDAAELVEEQAVVEPVDPPRVANSTSSRVRYGPWSRMTSALKSPKIVSARALSYESPLLPTEDSIAAAASRFVYRIERYSAIAVMDELVDLRTCMECLLQGSRARSLRREFDTRQPTILRENTSRTKATYTKPA